MCFPVVELTIGKKKKIQSIQMEMEDVRILRENNDTLPYM